MNLLPTSFQKARSNIEPSPDDVDKAPKCHIAVRDVLEAAQPLKDIGISTILIGSYKRQVSIRRVKDVDVFCKLPDLDSILTGKGKARFPDEASARYATVLGLTVRAQTAQQGVSGLAWLVKEAGAEWVQFFATDLFRLMREKGQFGDLARQISANAELKDFARNMRDLIFSV